MVAMASSLEDIRSCVSCKDVGSVRYHMGSALITMVEMFHALHSLWVSLFPFVMLWWNVMLCATCAKYFSWNRSRLRSPIAGRRLYGNIMQDTGLFAAALNVEESLILSASCADDAWHAEKRQMSITSDQRGSCPVALPRQDPGVSIYAFRHQGGVCEEERQRGSSRQEVSVCIQAFPHQRGLCKCDVYIDVAVPCTDEWSPHLLNQVEELDACESASIDSPAESTRSYISKLSSLSFLDGRGPQQSGSLRPSHWAACASLLPQQVPLLDSRNLAEYLWLQLSLRRKGDMLNIKVPMPILGDWLQLCDGCPVSCVPALFWGKEYPDLAWHFIQFLTSGTKNVDHTTSQLLLPATKITNTISLAEGAMEDVELRSRDLLSSSSFHRDVGEDGTHCVEDVGGIYGRPLGDADDGFYDGDSDFDDNVEDNGDGFSDYDFVDDNGACGNSLEMTQLHVAHTWWDEDVVLVDKQEGEEEDSMEQAWQVV